MTACKSPQDYREEADKAADAIIAQKQREALGYTETFTIEQPADTLRKRLMLEQDLPFSMPATLGSYYLTPIPHWPADNYIEQRAAFPGEPLVVPPEHRPLRLTLNEALQVAARNSREYQDRKEAVYLAALDLDLERDFFRTTWSGVLDGGAIAELAPEDDIVGLEGGGVGSVTQRFRNGVSMTGRIGIDLVKLLTQGEDSSLGLFGDASIAIPLLRGSGAYINAEPLTQAERNAVYAIWDFEQFKRNFAVQVASSYLGVLQGQDAIRNAESSYRGYVISSRRTRRLAEAGTVSGGGGGGGSSSLVVSLGQAAQRELSARARWIAAQQAHERRLDVFKNLLGLPTDARIELDRQELSRLVAEVEESLALVDMESRQATDEEVGIDGNFPAADDPVILVPPSREGAGPYELDPERAVELALTNRLDLRIAQGRVYDAQRRVTVAADRLRAELTLLGTAATGERRTLGSAGLDDSTSLPLDRARYDALLTLDLPLERTAERNAYRESLINLEGSVRNLQDTEDQIKLDIRDALRTLLTSRENLRIQAEAVRLAQRRVAAANMMFEAGRGQIRDVLEAQDDLVEAQDSVTEALVDYRITELELQRDLGLLEVDAEGLWREWDPREVMNEQP